jgi:hypothetical protein
MGLRAGAGLGGELLVGGVALAHLAELGEDLSGALRFKEA